MSILGERFFKLSKKTNGSITFKDTLREHNNGGFE